MAAERRIESIRKEIAEYKGSDLKRDLGLASAQTLYESIDMLGRDEPELSELVLGNLRAEVKETEDRYRSKPSPTSPLTGKSLGEDLK
jgi:hypothetical protein